MIAWAAIEQIHSKCVRYIREPFYHPVWPLDKLGDPPTHPSF